MLHRRQTGRVLPGLIVMLGLALRAYPVPIQEAIEVALTENPGLQQAMHRVDAASGALLQAEAAYYPHVTLSGEYAWTDSPTQAFMMTLNQRALALNDPALDFNNPDDTDNLHAAATVRYTLYDGGMRQARRQQATWGSEAEAHTVDALHNQLIYQVTKAYLRALQARERITVREAELASMEEHLRVAQRRLDEGAAVITDVLNLQVQMEQAREKRIAAQNGLRLALSALNTAIGVDLVTADALIPPGDALPDLPAARVNQLRDHPELKATRSLLGIREAAIGASRSQGRPALNAFGSLNWDQDPSDDGEHSYVVGVAVQWSLFDGFRTRGALHEAQAQKRETEARYTDTHNQLRHALTQARIRAEDARERLAVARTGAERAREAQRITREQYEAGAVTVSDLLTAQAGLTSALMRRTAAFYDYLIARTDVGRAQGTLRTMYEEEGLL